MLDRIVALGNSDGLWTTPPGCEEMRDGEEWLEVEDIKLVLTQMCEEAGVRLLLHTTASDVILDPAAASPTVAGVIFENKTGRFAIKANAVVDATADADIVWKALGPAGVVMRPPEERIGAGFYVYYGGVDSARFVEYALGQSEVRGYPDPHKYPEKVRRHLAESKLILLTGFTEVLERADEVGLMDQVEEAFEAADCNGLLQAGMKWVGDGRWCLHVAALNFNLLDAWVLTRHEVLRTKLEHLMLAIMRLAPGWENAFIARTSVHMGQRETRVPKTVHMLTSDDIFAPQHDRPDAIGRSGAHDPGKNRLREAYPIPYGILVPETLEGVICCARSVGTASSRALDAHRGITPTIVVGQAAGTAAALAVSRGTRIREVDLTELRARLRAADVVLDLEVMDLPTIPPDFNPKARPAD
jgi:hypothetical protein